MADFIEDPKIAASIDELTRRWPEIGAAADHPLTEFFLNRKETKTRWLHKLSTEFGWLPIPILMYAAAACIYPRLMERHGIMFVWAVIFVYDYVKRHSKPKKEFNLTDPFQLLTGVGDPSQWEQLALLPLQYRDVAGIFLGCSYHMARRHQFDNTRIVLTVGIIAVATWYFRHTLNLFAFIPCLLFLLYSIHVISTNPAQFLHNRMSDLNAALSMGNRKRNREFNYNFEFFGILCLPAAVSCILVQFTGVSGFVINTSMLAWGFLFLIASSMCNQLDLETKFCSLNEDEKPKYEKRVDEIIGRK